MSPTPETLREANMQKRRARVLAAAHQLLAQQGFEGLNVRDVAHLAGVTVPTIYNLIGNKEQLLITLISDVLREIESRVHTVGDRTPLALAVAVVTESTGLFAEDEAYYRSAFLAVEALDQTDAPHPEAARIFAWAERLITEGIEACRTAGLLRGRIPAAAMGELIMRSFRISCRAWALRQVPIDAFRRTALSDVYVTLAADAVDTFHRRLMQKFSEQAADDAARPSNNKTIKTNRGDKP